MKKIIVIIACLSSFFSFIPEQPSFSSSETYDYCKSQHQIPSQECESLVDLFKATDGYQWLMKTNWLRSVPLSEWYGISTDNGHVIKINLANNGLSGTIPQSLRALVKLQEVDLSGNDLEGDIPVSAWQESRFLYDQYNKQEIENIHRENLLDIPNHGEEISLFLEPRHEDTEINLFATEYSENDQPEKYANSVDFDCNMVTDLIPEECNILKNLYEVTNGDNWISATN